MIFSKNLYAYCIIFGQEVQLFFKKRGRKSKGQKVEFSVVFVANWVSVWYDRKDYIEEDTQKENIMLTSKQRAFLRGMANGIGRNFSGRQERRNP